MDYHKILSNLTINDLGKHLLNITDLFFKPIKSWKKIISQRKESYDFFLLFIIYYSIATYFIVDNVKFIIPFVILDLFLTFIPFTFLYVPFIYFRKKWNKKVKSNRLFRLLFILKIQFNIVIIGIGLLIRWTSIESPFIVLENYLWVILITFITVFPLLLKLKFYQKIIWIFSNYIFNQIFFIILFIIFDNIPAIEANKILEEIPIYTPTLEYDNFNFNYNFTDVDFNEDYYLAIVEYKNKKVFYVKNQFATNKLMLELLEINVHNEKMKIILDSFLKKPKKQRKINKISIFEKKISKKHLDSLRLEFNIKFYDDLKLTDSLKSKAKFETNKNIFKIINKQLNFYHFLYTNNKAILNVINTKPLFLVEINEKDYIVVYKYTNKAALQRKQLIENLRNELFIRNKKTNFLQNIYTYPTKYIIEFLQ